METKDGTDDAASNAFLHMLLSTSKIKNSAEVVLGETTIDFLSALST